MADRRTEKSCAAHKAKGERAQKKYLLAPLSAEIRRLHSVRAAPFLPPNRLAEVQAQLDVLESLAAGIQKAGDWSGIKAAIEFIESFAFDHRLTVATQKAQPHAVSDRPSGNRI